MDKYVLIASTGNQDIKFFLHDAKKTYPVAVATISKARNDKDCLSIREVHQKLLSREIDYTFLSIEDSLGKTADIKFDSRLNPIISCKQDTFEAMKTQGKYLLFAAKLDAAIQTLKHMNGIDVVGGLFFGTDRPGRNGEPIASHKLLAEYFASQFDHFDNNFEELPGHETKNLSCKVFWANQTKELTASSGWEYEGKGEDYPVKRIIARQIDQSIKIFLEMFGGNTNVLLSHTGGMADLKAVLTASVKFRTQGMLLESHQTEESEKFNAIAFDQLKKERHIISRRDSLDIRNLVEDRLLQGDFNGAWSACAHLHSQQGLAHDIWICAVKIVKCYMRGESIQNKDYPVDAILIHDFELKQCFTDLKNLITELTLTNTLKNQIKSTLSHTLFSVEAALQYKKMEELDIKNALLDCATLSDQLLRACVFLYLEQEKDSYSFVDNLDFTRDPVLQNKSAKTEGFDKGKLDLKRKREYWRKTLEHHAGSFDVSNLYHSRMEKGNKSCKALQHYRNAISHGKSIDRDFHLLILAQACTQSKDSHQLWNPALTARTGSTPSTGECFLNQHYVHLIESSLCYGNNYLQQQYKKLQEILLKIVRSSIYIPPEKLL